MSKNYAKITQGNREHKDYNEKVYCAFNWNSRKRQKNREHILKGNSWKFSRIVKQRQSSRPPSLINFKHNENTQIYTEIYRHIMVPLQKIKCREMALKIVRTKREVKNRKWTV